MNVDENKIKMIRLLTNANDLMNEEKLDYIREILDR